MSIRCSCHSLYPSALCCSASSCALICYGCGTTGYDRGVWRRSPVDVRGRVGSWCCPWSEEILHVRVASCDRSGGGWRPWWSDSDAATAAPTCTSIDSRNRKELLAPTTRLLLPHRLSSADRRTGSGSSPVRLSGTADRYCHV